MPHALQRFAEWYLGLPSAGAGQGTTWRLDWGPSAGAEYAVGTLWGLAVAAAVAVAVIYLKETSSVGWRRRAGLLLLRLAAIVVLVLMLGRISVRVDRTELPTVAVLIDTSASMGLVDRYENRALASAVQQLAPGGANRPPTRLQLAQAVLTRRQGAWLAALARTHQVRLFAFDAHLRDITADAPAPDGSPEAAWTPTVAELTPQGEATAPATAVRELLDDYRGTSLAAVVLLTDGVASAGDAERLSRGAAAAQERGAPLYPIGIGSPDPIRDLELFDLQGADVITLGEPITLAFRQRSFGLSGQTTHVQVTIAGEEAPAAVQTIVAGADNQPESVEVTFPLEREGTYELTVAAAPLPGEVELQNNVLRHRVEVRQDRLRVLLVEGLPRWEYRALKPVLERDDTVQVDTFLQSADLEFAAEDRTSLRFFPATQEQLNQYDVVLWGDVSLGEFDAGAAERLRTFVAEHGGGVAFLSGEQHNPLQYAGTPLEILLPVSLLNAAGGYITEAAAPEAFRLQRTLEGKGHYFLRLADDPLEDDGVWQSLPAEMTWCVQAEQVKPGASVLATGSGGGLSATPLLAWQRYGKGQVLYHGVDSLWMWRKRVGDLYYGRYWSQAVRALAAGRRGEDDAGRRLTSDRLVYAPGDEVRLRLSDDGGVDGESPEAVIDSQAGERFRSMFALRPGSAGEWEAVLRDLPVGEFRAHLAGDDAGGAACQFRIERPDRELRERSLASADLQQAARLSHGEYHSLATAEQVPAAIPRGRPVRLTESEPIGLWKRWEFLTLLILLLTCEWLLRQRARLV